MDGLKQRIIGALVLVCLAVIFVPMIFDEPHSERQATPITIPEEPPFPEVDMPDEPAMETDNYGLESQADPSLSEDPVAQAEPQPSSEESAGDTGESAGYRLIENTDQENAGSSAPEEVAQSEPAEEQKPAEFTRSLEGAWIVQLGSFGKESNARGLRDKVLELGYDAHLQQVGSGDGRLTRVFSGPFADKADAEDAKRLLDNEFGLDSLITRGDK